MTDDPLSTCSTAVACSVALAEAKKLSPIQHIINSFRFLFKWKLCCIRDYSWRDMNTCLLTSDREMTTDPSIATPKTNIATNELYSDCYQQKGWVLTSGSKNDGHTVASLKSTPERTTLHKRGQLEFHCPCKQLRRFQTVLFRWLSL